MHDSKSFREFNTGATDELHWGTKTQILLKIWKDTKHAIRNSIHKIYTTATKLSQTQYICWMYSAINFHVMETAV